MRARNGSRRNVDLTGPLCFHAALVVGSRARAVPLAVHRSRVGPCPRPPPALSQNGTQKRQSTNEQATETHTRGPAGAATIAALMQTKEPPGTTRVRRSPIHGRGLFALQTIGSGDYIGRYEGEITQRDGCYVLWVENDARDGVYGVRGRNSLRFVNHSAEPNAEFDGEELFSLRRIEPDEEITVDYGPEWAEDER